MKENNRIFYLDYLRYISCMAVILIHISCNYLMYDFKSVNFFVGNIVDSLSRFAVPIFVMISGALLLDSNYNYTHEKNFKHIIKYILFFIFWSTIYSIYVNVYLTNGVVNTNKFINSIINGHGHLWFIKMICCLYLLVPLVRCLINKYGTKFVKHFLILSIFLISLLPLVMKFLTFFLPSAIYLSSIFEKIVGNYFCYLIYFLLGWYLIHNNLNKKIIYFLGILSVLFEIIASNILSMIANTQFLFYKDLYFCVLLQSIFVFIAAKNYFSNKKASKYKEKIVNSVSKYSLGIYGVHVLYISLSWNYLFKIGIIEAWKVIPMIFVFTFAASYFTSLILSKIKPLKRFFV